MNSENDDVNVEEQQLETAAPSPEAIVRPPIMKPNAAKPSPDKPKGTENNKIIRLLEKNPLGMTLPEMAGGPRQLKKIRTLRPILAEAIKTGQVMPISQRAGHTVYRLVKFLGPR